MVLASRSWEVGLRLEPIRGRLNHRHGRDMVQTGYIGNTSDRARR